MAAGIGGSIFGGISSAKERRRERRRQEQELREARTEFARDYYQDMTQRADMQYLLTRQREQLMEANRAARRTGVVAGGSTAREAVAKDAAIGGMAQTMGRIGAMSQQQKQAAQNAYRSARSRYSANMSQLAQQGANQGAVLQQTAGQIVAAAPRLAAGSGTTPTATTTAVTPGLDELYDQYGHLA